MTVPPPIIRDTPADMHAAVDEIAEGWRRALAERRTAVGLRARRYDGVGGQPVGDHADPTGDQATRGNPRTGAFLAELHDVARMFIDRIPPAPEGWRQAMHRELEAAPTGWSPAAVAGLFRLAAHAAAWWPDELETGDRVGEVTVGGRSNLVEKCGLCQEPVVGGRDVHGQATLRRVDGVPFHAAGLGCYWQVWRQRRRGA